MANPDTISALAQLIAEVCAVAPSSVRPESKLLAFGLDSIRLLDLIMAVEDRFGLQLSESDPELAAVETVTHLADLIERRRGAGV